MFYYVSTQLELYITYLSMAEAGGIMELGLDLPCWAAGLFFFWPRSDDPKDLHLFLAEAWETIGSMICTQCTWGAKAHGVKSGYKVGTMIRLAFH